jgi:hypothetical protein
MRRFPWELDSDAGNWPNLALQPMPVALRDSFFPPFHRTCRLPFRPSHGRQPYWTTRPRPCRHPSVVASPRRRFPSLGASWSRCWFHFAPAAQMKHQRRPRNGGQKHCHGETFRRTTWCPPPPHLAPPRELQRPIRFRADRASASREGDECSYILLGTFSNCRASRQTTAQFDVPWQLFGIPVPLLYTASAGLKSKVLQVRQ